MKLYFRHPKWLAAKFILTLACVIAWFFLLARGAIATEIQSTSARDSLREVKLAKFFQHYGSPLADSASVFVSEADKNGLDYRLLPAISGVESTFGRNYILGTYNVYGWGGGEIRFSSWQEGISQVSKGLKENYINKGAIDLEAVSWIYCPPGNLSWAAKVKHFMEQIDQTDTTISNNDPAFSLALTI